MKINTIKEMKDFLSKYPDDMKIALRSGYAADIELPVLAEEFSVETATEDIADTEIKAGDKYLSLFCFEE